MNATELVTLERNSLEPPRRIISGDRGITFLKSRVRDCSNEHELSFSVCSAMELNVGHGCKFESKGIDVLLNDILIEFKFGHPLTKTGELAKALSQAIYYLHKFVEEIKPIPYTIMIIENTTAGIFNSSTFMQFVESVKYDWSSEPSNPDPTLVNDIKCYLNIICYDITKFKYKDSFEDYFTHTKNLIKLDAAYTPPIHYGESLCRGYHLYLVDNNYKHPLLHIDEYLKYILYETSSVWGDDRGRIEKSGADLLINDSVKKTLKLANDPHIYTTDMYIVYDICRAAEESITSNNKILIIATLEILMVVVGHLGSNTDNVLFATPSKTKAIEASKILNNEDHVWIYNEDYKKEGVIKFIMEKEETNFDFITGNVPWDDGIDKKFMLECKKLLAPNGTMALITSASYLRGNDGKALRQSLVLTGNIKKIWTYPAAVFINPDTQKPIKSVGAGILYKKGEEQGITTLTRYMNGEVFETTTEFNIDTGAMLYLGNEGKELWNKCCSKNCDTIPLVPYKDSTKPKIHFSSKLDLVYFGSSKPLGKITGKQILTGVQIDLDGTNNWVPELKKGDEDKNSAKRYMLEFSEKNMAWNAYFHFRMRVWGLMLGMTNTISHINSQSVGSMPFDILIGAYDSPEAYEEAYYKSKELSPELIEWIKKVGIEYSSNIKTESAQNLKGDLIVCEIVRTAERVKITGELFTPRYHIDTILNTLEADGLCNGDKKVLEPSCGDGNFILAIIERKLNSGMTVTAALSTTYGCDLMQDNIDLCHKRILELVGDTTEHRGIVTKQIVCTDFFNWDYDNWCAKVLGSELIDSGEPFLPKKKVIKLAEAPKPTIDDSMLDF